VIALAWRQHRAQLLGALAILALLGGYLAFTKQQMTADLSSLGLTHCLAAHGDCSGASGVFLDRHGQALTVLGWLNLLPMLAGVFLGAPLIARETEQGTHRLAWTQATSRGRWFTVKLLLLAATTVAVSVALTALIGWWFHPLAQLAGAGYSSDSRMSPNVFDFSGVLPIGYTLYAFALGVAAGALLRRTIPAMALSVIGYLALRFSLQDLRGHLVSPVTTTGPILTTKPFHGAWVLSTSYTNHAGQPVGYGTLITTCPNNKGSALDASCLTAKGFHLVQTYQPDSHFWALQGTETGIYLTAAIALLGAAAWWTTRHLS